MDESQNKLRIKYFPVLIFSVVAVTLVGTAYFFTKNFMADRQRALSFKNLPPRPVLDRPRTVDGKQIKTYTAKELEEARRKGQLPAGMTQPVPPNQATAANEAAVQRSLKTLEEINRVNQMNQQLIEQQQRMQRQQKQ